MESANLHDHQQQQQQQQLLVESSPLVNPSFYEVGTTRAPSWTPYTILHNNGNNFNPNIINGAAPINSRDPYCLNASNSMIQDLGFGSFTSLSSMSAHDLQLSRIKEELPSSSSSNHSSYPKLTEMLNSSPSSPSSIDLDSHLLLHPSSNSSSYIKNEQRDHLLKTFSSGCQINGLQLAPAAGGGLFYSTPASRRSFSQIYPTINISSLNQVQASSEVSSNSLAMNLEALDLFNSTRISGTTNISHSSQDHLGHSKSSLDYNMQHQLSHRPSNSPTNVSPFNNGGTEVKRSSSFLETKAPQATPKKSRLDSRTSCPPFKVRKEKLGDRIAALQQLVAPFGKTDTASVLMEAIGYIKFLQNQVETLSVPYMKSSRNKAGKMQGDSGEDGELKGATRDLRSRGLCLVPLTCLSYVTDGGGGSGVWPPPNFGGPAAGS